MGRTFREKLIASCAVAVAAVVASAAMAPAAAAAPNVSVRLVISGTGPHYGSYEVIDTGIFLVYVGEPDGIASVSTQCEVSVRRGANLIAAVEAAKSKRCISSFIARGGSSSRFGSSGIRCIESICENRPAELGVWTAESNAGPTCPTCYRAVDGDVVRILLRPSPCGSDRHQLRCP